MSVITQVITSDSASGAQMIDGSLKFDGSSQYLSRNFGSGDRKTWTWSAWVKRYTFGVANYGLFSYYPGSGNGGFIRFSDDSSGDTLRFYSDTNSISIVSEEKYRDTGWYHIVIAVDTTQGTDTNRVKRYVNGVQQTTNASNTWPSPSEELLFNQSGNHFLGKVQASNYGPVAMSNVYFIDGQQLGPENFGFTDLLTNTWRPKKFTGSFTSDYSGVFAPYSAAARLSAFTTAGTVAEDATSYTLPMSNPAHYGGKVLDGGSGGFYVQTVNSATEDFFMGCWIKVDTLVAGNQMGIDITSGYKYFELRSGGVIGIRHVGGSRADSSATSVADGNWHHIAFSRVGSTLYGYVDGTSVITTTSGVSGNTVGANEQFNFFGAPSGGGYNLDGQLIDSFVYIGQGQSSNFSVPTAPLVDNSGSINHYSGFSDSQLYYASPLVTVSGSTPNSLVDYIGTNGFYLPFDGNSPIGEDKSGLGNNWTPVNFGGSVALDNPIVSGAKPILNTNQGGTVAGLGVFGSKENRDYTVTVAPKTGGGNAFYLDGVERPALTGLIRGSTYTFNTTDSTNNTHPFIFGTTAEGANYTDGVARSHNDGTTWSNSLSASDGFAGGLGATRAFDGTESSPDRAGNNNTNGGGNLTFTCDLKNVHKVEVRTGIQNVVTINGSIHAGTATLDPQYVVYEPGSSFNLTEVKITSNGSVGYRCDLYSIKVDNVLLLDSTDNRYTAITVPHNSPNTLYYHCGQHSGMGNSISDITTDVTKADPYAWKNVLAVPLVGNNIDVSNSVNCTSTTKVMSNVGDAAASSDTSNFYNGSFEFDGSSDGITSPYYNDFDFTSGDFTVECWVKQDDTSGFDVFVGKYGGSSDGEFIVGKNGNTPTFYWQDDDGNNNINATNFTGNTDSWYHMACVREGNVFTMYINGVCENSTTDNTPLETTNNNLTIGFENDQSSSPFDGYLQDVRIYKGVAKYSGTTVGTQYFVPTSTNPDILPDTPSGVSVKPKLTKITDGAVAFDGSGDYLSVTGPGTLAASSNWCMECTFYCTGTSSGTYRIMGANESSESSEYLQMRIRNGQYQFYTENASTLTGTAAFNKWTHIALTKSGTTVRAFVDGKQLWSTTDNNSDNITTLITGWGYSSEYFPGFISNARFVNGSSVYTADFKPPTSPLTNITNTYLLCCQSTTSADAAAVQPSITSYFTGGTALTWASSPIGSKWTLSNGDKNATSSGGSGYTGADVFSVALAANTTYAWTLDITNGDSTGGWYFADVQSNTGTHADQKGGNSLGLRGANTQAGYYGTFASANGGSDGQNKITMNSDVSPNGAKSIDFVVYRPASGTGKVWVKANTASTWIGGGDPSNTSSTATFIIPDGTTYFGFIDYDSGDTTTCNMRGDGDITSPPLLANGAAATNFNPFNTDINTVRGQETGYCIFNVLRERTAGYNPTFKDGNLFMDGRGDGTGTLSAQSGKFYFEVTVDTVGSSGQIYLGVQNAAYSGTERNWGNDNIAAIRDTGVFYGTGMTGTAGSYTAGDTMSFAFDVDNNKLYIAKNGVYFNGGVPSQGTGFTHSGINFPGGYTPIVSDSQTGQKYRLNCGQKPFKFSPPDGYQPLNVANIRADRVFARPDKFVKATTFSGTGALNNVVSLGFKPDLLWFKARGASEYNTWIDSVRGRIKTLYSNNDHGEGSASSALQSIDDTTITVGNYNFTNDSTSPGMVVWTWKAGGNAGTWNKDGFAFASAADVGLTGITSPATLVGASIGTEQGFSIIRWNRGADHPSWSTGVIPHGLTQAPDMIITKNLGSGHGWMVFHQGKGTGRVYLNDPGTGDGSGYTTLPTATHFTIDNTSDADSSDDCISYCWHDVPGLQKFGSYTGVNSADGPFLEFGFRPAIIMFKNISSGSTEWVILDNKRNGFNGTGGNNILFPSTTDTENATQYGDFLSNGFKFRVNSSYVNSTDTFIYAAWADTPISNLYGGQPNAR